MRLARPLARIDGGTPELLPSIGDGAYLVVGTVQGGANQQGGGGVHVGHTLVQVTFVEGAGLPAAQVRRELVAVLRLVASKG